MTSGKGKKRQRQDDPAPSRRSERLARREKQANDTAKKTGEESDPKAEEKVFDIGLTRALILRHKVALEHWIRTDEDIRRAVKEWREDPVAAERRYAHISDWDVSRVTDMSWLFYVEYGVNKFDEDLSRWQTCNVTNMSRMFCGASSFTSDLSKWQTGNVKNMSRMFCGASSFTSDLSKWQTGNVTDMHEMFYEASSFTSDLSQWQTGNVTNMSEMFYDASSFNISTSASARTWCSPLLAFILSRTFFALETETRCPSLCWLLPVSILMATLAAYNSLTTHQRNEMA